MRSFTEIVPGIFQLKAPLGSQWTGITLVRGEKNYLIDSGCNAETVDEILIPALGELGLVPDSLDWVLCTHCHGDHVGGHYRLMQCSRTQFGAYVGSADKIRDPLKYNKRIRAAYPEHSSPPAPVLIGVKPDALFEDGRILDGCLQLIATPGHDTDTVCWYHLPTKTMICGDTLQQNGTAGQGMALYMDLPAYQRSLKVIMERNPENLLTGHEYTPLGEKAIGKLAVAEYIASCECFVNYYSSFLAGLIQKGETDHVEMTKKLIRSMAHTPPEKLFLALYTADAHLRELTK